MIDAAYVRDMARYNSWQNDQLMRILQALPKAELTQDHGAFFGSLLGTANHLLWGDTIWMSRFDPSMERPAGGIEQSVTLHPTVGAWAADRFRVDGKIRHWSNSLRNLDLKSSISFASSVLKKDVTTPVAPAVVHFFNHQTHHRGQIHAMLTAGGHDAPVSDLFLMPKDA